MKMSKFTLVIAMLIAMPFAIFSCSSGGGGEIGNDNSISFDENSQIYNYSDGSSYVGDEVIEICADGGCLRTGSVANGIVNLELPINVPYGYLEVDDNTGCSGSLKDVRVFQGDFKLSNGSALHIRYRDNQIREDVNYSYYERAGKLTCNIANPKMSVTIDAKSGWNKIYSRRIYDANRNMTLEVSTKNILTNEVKWLLY